jgi:hypothetical protein
MRRLIAVLAIVLGLVGCGTVMPASPEPFELAHSHEPADGRSGPCSLGWWTGGRLVVDEQRGGTSIVVEGGDFSTPGDALPIAWWPKFTGRRVGGEVEILDPDQNVVATTGRRYRILAAFPFDAGFVVCGNCRAEPCITELLGGSNPTDRSSSRIALTVRRPTDTGRLSAT